jgi:ankyrin repeat protein
MKWRIDRTLGGLVLLAWFALLINVAIGAKPEQAVQQKRLNQRLIMAIKANDTATAVALLAKGADPNTKYISPYIRWQCSAFLLAVQGEGMGAVPENLPLIKALIDKGADVNARDQHGTTALMTAAANGHLGTIRLLLDRGAKVNLKDNDSDDVPDLGGARIVHFRGRTALQYAQSCESIQAMRLLIAHGADVNVRDEEGVNLLMYAAIDGDTAKMRLLLAHGTDVNARDTTGRTALMFAANFAKRDAMTLLHEHGATVNARDNKGETALMHNMDGPRDNPRTLKMLLAMGADCHVKSQEGKTALSIALQKNYTESVRLLKQAGEQE